MSYNIEFYRQAKEKVCKRFPAKYIRIAHKEQKKKKKENGIGT